MVRSPGWTAAAVISTERLTLEPLQVEHADELAPLLDDERLHEYIGGHPATVEQLRARYDRLVTGHSADGAQGWYNWIARDDVLGTVVGTVQATLQERHGRTEAEIAWVVTVPHQGRGYATEAAAAMCDWLLEHGVDVLVAHVHPEHRASMAVARRLGLTPTAVVVDGETRWTT